MRDLMYLFVCFAFIFSSCSNKNRTNDSDLNSQNISVNENFEKEQNIEIKILSDIEDNFKIGDILKFSVIKKDTLNIDSVKFYINNELIDTKEELPYVLEWNSINSRVGRVNFKARTFSKDGNSSEKVYFTMLSDIVPKEYSYEVINTYIHDKGAYTQGLVYENGYLFEATGQKGESTLRKVELKKGNVLQAYTIASEIFGEGITIFNDKIIQLSWQAHIGFIYDKETFKLLMKFNYSTEGWGLTNDGKNLIMSDGSHKLYILDTESYSQIDKLEVYDNNGPVNQLNELEYINGDIYANIYTTDKIAIIDAKTGKIKAYIDLTKILPQKDYEKGRTDVLNGIAYDSEGDRLFVTGKYWPKLFEIKLTDK